LAQTVAGEVIAPVFVASGAAAGCAAALAAAAAGDRIVVCGSFHTVGPAIDWLETHHPALAGHGDPVAAPRAIDVPG
jgi:folylpolyglutamate synthase/dihydropteroate synthase